MKNIFKSNQVVKHSSTTWSKINIFLISVLLVVFAFGLVSDTYAVCSTCPQFNDCPQDKETLRLKNRTQGDTVWHDPISANCGERVAFNVYYHNTIVGSVANNTKIKINYPCTETSNIVTTAFLWADNASQVYDNGTINSSTPQKLIFDSTAQWYPNQTTTNPTNISVTQVSSCSVQVNIGDIAGGWPSQGQVVFEATLTGCQQTVPTVDIKANGSDGTITIPYNSSANLTWTSTNATSCNASGDWSGTKGTSGSETTYNLTYSKIYTITCTGSGGSASDSVTVNTQSQQISYVNLTASPSSGCAPLNNVDLTASVSGTTYYYQNITYYFDCTNDGYWDRTVSSSSTSYTAYDACNYSTSGNYYAKVRVESGGFTAENTTPIYVSSCSTQTLSITKLVRNLTDNTAWLNEVSADPGEFLAYSIQITASSGSSTSNVILTDVPRTITIPYNSSANLTWTSSNATSCYASGDWSGTKSTSGSETTYNLTYSKTYTITCTGSGGSASDSVTVNIQSQQISYVNLTASPSSGCAPLNNVDLTASVSGTTYYQNITYYFDCTNDGYWDRTTTSSSSSYTAYDVCNYSSSGNYNARVKVESGGFTTENTTPIYVSSCSNPTSFSITKLVRNLTDNTAWLNEVSADPGEFLAYSIQITASSGSSMSNVILTDILPAKITYRGNLKIDGVSSSGDIVSGLNLGTLYSGQSKTVTFEAQAASVNDFNFGTTTLTNTATISSGSITNSDTATVSVLKRGVAGAVTGISTGINPLYILPFFVLILSLVLYLLVHYLENSKNPLIRKILGVYYKIRMYMFR